MSYISSPNLLRSMSMLHMVTAYYLLVSPSTLIKQNLVGVLGASMKLPDPLITSSSSAIVHPASGSLDSPSPAAALAALFLVYLSINDFLSVALPEEIYLSYWSSQAATRLAFFLSVTSWIYLTRPEQDTETGTYYGKSWGHELKNSLVFTWSFLNTCVMFWTFLSLRDERAKAAGRIAEKRRQEEESR